MTDHNDRTWFDMAGNFHSEALRVVERYRMVDAGTIDYEATMEDPKVFTRPWTIRMPLYRSEGNDARSGVSMPRGARRSAWDFEPEPRTLVKAAPLQRLPPVTCVAIRRRHQPQSPQERRPRGRPPGRRGAQSQRVLSGRRGRRGGVSRSTTSRSLQAASGVLDDLPTLPYQRWAIEEKRTRNLPERGYDDPTAHCFVGGVPRATYVPSPFHILQTSTHVGILHERMSWRIIPLVGHVPLPDTVRLWMGDSVGRWDGRTLVIETRNLNGKTWLDEVGDVIGHAATGDRAVSADRNRCCAI